MPGFKVADFGVDRKGYWTRHSAMQIILHFATCGVLNLSIQPNQTSTVTGHRCILSDETHLTVMSGL